MNLFRVRRKVEWLNQNQRLGGQHQNHRPNVTRNHKQSLKTGMEELVYTMRCVKALIYMKLNEI